MSSFDTTFRMEEKELKALLMIACARSLMIVLEAKFKDEAAGRIMIEDLVDKIVSETIQRKFNIK